MWAHSCEEQKKEKKSLVHSSEEKSDDTEIGLRGGKKNEHCRSLLMCALLRSDWLARGGTELSLHCTKVESLT